MNKNIKPSIASTVLTICIGSLLSLFFIFIILPAILIGFLFLITYVHSSKDNIRETYLYKLENNIDIENKFHYNAFNAIGTNTLSLIINDKKPPLSTYKTKGNTTTEQENMKLIFSEANYDVYYFSQTVLYDLKDSKSRTEEKPIIIFKNSEIKSFINDSTYISDDKSIFDETNNNDDKFKDIKVKIALNELENFHGEYIYNECLKYLNSHPEYKHNYFNQKKP